MSKYTVVKGIVKLYFLAALAGSFTHIICASHKVGLEGWEAYSTPFMIDGLAVIGIIMRSEAFSRQTRKIGFRVQLVMGSMSLVANVYAAHNHGGMIYGVGIVSLFIFAEWLSDHMDSAAVDVQREAEQIAAQAAAERETKKAASVAKAQATRARNARTRKAQDKALESLLK